MKTILLITSMLFACFSHAGAITTKMVQLSMATEQYGNVKLVDAITDDVGVHPCINTKYFLSFDKSTEHGKQIYALLLAAYLSDKAVYFEYSATECGLWNSQALISRADLRG